MAMVNMESTVAMVDMEIVHMARMAIIARVTMEVTQMIPLRINLLNGIIIHI